VSKGWPGRIGQRFKHEGERSETLTVDDFVDVKPPLSTELRSRLQRLCNRLNQNQLGTTEFNKFQEPNLIWFGTRGSEVQILSPRFLDSVRYSPECFRNGL
jgi:hypothetical protein